MIGSLPAKQHYRIPALPHDDPGLVVRLSGTSDGNASPQDDVPTRPLTRLMPMATDPTIAIMQLHLPFWSAKL